MPLLIWQELPVCYPEAEDILFLCYYHTVWLLWLYNIFWNQEVWCSQIFFFQDCFGFLVFFAVFFDLLVCFQAVAFISNVSMSIQVRQFFEGVVFFEYISRNGIAGSSIFNLLKNLHTVSKMDVSIYILTNRIQEFLYSVFLPSLVIFLLFYNSYPNRYEVISYCGFDLHFLD